MYIEVVVVVLQVVDVEPSPSLDYILYYVFGMNFYCSAVQVLVLDKIYIGYNGNSNRLYIYIYNIPTYNIRNNNIMYVLYYNNVCIIHNTIL